MVRSIEGKSAQYLGQCMGPSVHRLVPRVDTYNLDRTDPFCET